MLYRYISLNKASSLLLVLSLRQRNNCINNDYVLQSPFPYITLFFLLSNITHDVIISSAYTTRVVSLHNARLTIQMKEIFSVFNKNCEVECDIF